MGLLLRAFFRSLQNLFLPGIIKIFFLCLVAYGIGMLGFIWALTALLDYYASLGILQGWVATLAGSFGGGLLGWFLFPLLYPVLMSFFDESMAEVIERQDYPHLTKASPPFWPTLWTDVLFSLKAIFLNILCLPLYVFMAPIGLVIYYGLNGYLLGTQFFRMAAGRRESMAEAEALRMQSRSAVMLGGVAISLASTVPLLNLAAPVLGVATMLHLYHLLKKTDEQQKLYAPLS